MTLRMPRLRLLVKLLLVVAVSALLSQAYAGLLDSQGIANAQKTVAGSSHSADSAAANDQAPGAIPYTQAQDILRSLNTPVHRVARLHKPSGTIAQAWYYLKRLAVILFVNGPSTSRDSGTKILRPPLSDAIHLLESAESAGHPNASYDLASLAFYGSHGHPQDFAAAFNRFRILAERDGHAGAQHMLGFYYATGMDNVVQKDQAKALLLHTFAADAGDLRAQMTVGFRHHAGIGTPRNCERSVEYYKQVADKAIEYVRSGPPGGQRLGKDSFRLADEAGGVYGDGASFSSSGLLARYGIAADSDQTMDDYLEYLDLMSRKGSLMSTFRLGEYYYHGSRALRQDFGIAKDFFQDIARRYWSSKDGKIKPDVDRELEKLASKAAGYLGSMFLRGEGVEQNFNKAKIWFRRGVENGDALCQYSLGLIHLQGLGVPVDAVKASEFLSAAADQDMAVAQVRLGALHLDQGDVATASRYFDLAVRHNNVEAIYYLAELTNLGVSVDRSCTTAALYYKLVAERAEALHSNWGEANDHYEQGEHDAALVLYMQAAEQGYEAAQANVAYILDRTARVYPSVLHSLFPSVFAFSASRLADAVLALTYWTRSAKQANVDSLVKMGDYYFAGLGTLFDDAARDPLASDSAPSDYGNGAPDSDKAAACYSAAAEKMSAQALWNLGWMHENGLGGLSRDFHLAKRYYDSALETNAEAYLPVTLALGKLRLRSWWNGVTGGSVKGMHAGDATRRRSFTEWLTEFLIAELGDAELLQHQHAHHQQGGIDADGIPTNEWDADETGLYDELDALGDNFWEAAVFAGLAAGLAALVWYRQTLRQRPQQDEGQDQQQPRDAAAPDPANWPAAGVGN